MLRPVPPSPPPLTLADVRARAAAYADETRGTWVVICLYRFETALDLIGLHTDLADALRDIDDEIETQQQVLSATAIEADEVHEAAWDLTVGEVMLRLECCTVTEPRREETQ
jgi:hypothetical protein